MAYSNKFKRFCSVLLLLVFAACGRQDAVEPADSQAVAIQNVVEASHVIVEAAAPKPVGRHVLIVGDSEACAVRPLAQRIFNEEAQKKLVPTDSVSVECKGGTTVQYWGVQGHLKEALQKHPNPDVVIVFLGTNHYGQNKAPDPTIVLDGIENSGAQCVWVGNTAVDGRRWRINSLIRDAVTPRCTYFDTEAAGIPLADNAHPTPQGAIKWLRLVWAVIPQKFEEEHE